jgi:hypothetical protein
MTSFTSAEVLYENSKRLQTLSPDDRRMVFSRHWTTAHATCGTRSAAATVV